MLINIQLVRFLAAFSIVVFHSVPLYQRAVPGLDLSLIRLSGFAGVDLFFVISGFIMHYTTSRQQGSRAASRFIRRRFSRVYTGYWPYFLIALIFYYFYAPPVLARKDLLTSFFLIPSSIQEKVLPVSWTLTFELYFYLLFSILLMFPGSVRSWMFRFFVAGLVLVNLTASLYFDLYSKEVFADTPRIMRLLVSPYTIEFFAGCLLCEHVLKARNFYPAGAFLVSGVLFAAGAAYSHWILDGAMEKGYYVMERVFFYGSAALFLVYAFVALEKKGAIIFRRFSTLFGGASYSLYLSHTLFFSAFVAMDIGRDLPGGYGVTVWIGVLTFYSVFHYLYVERPFYALAKRILYV